MASGSVTKRGKGYMARWREQPGAPERSKAFGRKTDASAYLAKTLDAINRGAYIDPARARATVGDYWPVWAARQPWREKTRSAYGSTFRHVLQRFEHWPLSAVKTGDVESWAAGLPLAASSVGLAVTHLSAMFEAAVRDGYVPANPCRGARRPEVIDEPIVPYTLDQLDRLTDACPDWFAVAVTLGAGVGLRQAEACGLSEDRVDWLRREVRVDRQLVTSRARYGVTSFGPLKTRRSYRSVPLSEPAVFALAAHRERFGTGADGLLLHDGGAPVHASKFRDVWQQTRRRAGLESARFHDTRHTFASVLLSGGVSVAAVAEYMGHSPATLLKVYAHLIPGDHDRARRALDVAFSRQIADSLRTDGLSEG